MSFIKRIKNIWRLSNLEVVEVGDKLVITNKENPKEFIRPKFTPAQIVNPNNILDEIEI